jgi:hypothetical protein
MNIPDNDPVPEPPRPAYDFFGHQRTGSSFPPTEVDGLPAPEFLDPSPAQPSLQEPALADAEAAPSAATSVADLEPPLLGGRHPDLSGEQEDESSASYTLRRFLRECLVALIILGIGVPLVLVLTRI